MEREGTNREREPRGVGRRAIGILGLIWLAAWAAWWVNSLRVESLAGPKKVGEERWLWFEVKPTICGDFCHNVDNPARIWMAGGNPYRDTRMQRSPSGPLFDAGGRYISAGTHCYPYPPLVHRLFSWTSLLRPKTSMVVWWAVQTAICVAGACVSWRTRQDLGLRAVPLSIILCGALYSTPVLYALERGNFDLVVLLCLMVALRLMRSGTPAGEVAAGMILAVAIWAKLYPGLMVVGLVALRRRRVLPGLVATGVAIGLADLRGLRLALANIERLVPLCKPFKPNFYVDIHSLSGSWSVIWGGTSLAIIPGTVASCALLMPLLGWVSYRIYRCPARARLAYPYMLWVVALATFLPATSIDYNLFYLPLAALAVWDRRDPVVVHMAMALLALWWQPIRMPIDGQLMLGFKLLGLVPVAISLVGRSRELGDIREDADAGRQPATRGSRVAGAAPGGRSRASSPALRAGTGSEVGE